MAAQADYRTDLAGIKKRELNERLARPSGPRENSSTLIPYSGGNLLDFSYDGDKFSGSFGSTKNIVLDLHTLRARGAQLFNENPYARGLKRRMQTNLINKGLELEAEPMPELTNMSEDEANAWADDVEAQFNIWGSNEALCDYHQADTFGELQEKIYGEALIDGDVLIVLVQNPFTKLPTIRVIPGHQILQPFGKSMPRKKRVVHGVELDDKNREQAYYVRGKKYGEFQRIPAWGEKSGRRIAWLFHGTDKRVGAVRGVPIFALILQSLKELDRYRDATQVKATLDSTIFASVEKNEDKPGTLPFTNSAVLKEDMQYPEPGINQEARTFTQNIQKPLVVFDELQTGEKIAPFQGSTGNINYAEFESAILSAIAWANEIPPEVLIQQFSKNYSASRGAINEFKIFLTKERNRFASKVTKRIYIEWLVSSVLLSEIDAPGLLEAWRDKRQYKLFGAWTASDWAGAIKPSVDLEKEVRAYAQMIAEGLITRDRACKELTGMKASRVAKRLKRENEDLVAAKIPLFEAEQEYGRQAGEQLAESVAGVVMGRLDEAIRDHLEGEAA